MDTFIFNRFFGRTAAGPVFYPFCDRKNPFSITDYQQAQLRPVVRTHVMLAALMLLSGIGFFVALTLMLSTMPHGFDTSLGFDLRWMYLLEFFQAGLITAVIVIYAIRVRKILHP